MTRERWKSLGALILSCLVGYALIVLLTSLGFNGWLDGANLFRGGPILMVKGTLVAVVAGVAGGLTAASFGRRRVLHASVVLIPLIADSIYSLLLPTRESLLVRVDGQPHVDGRDDCRRLPSVCHRWDARRRGSEFVPAESWSSLNQWVTT